MAASGVCTFSSNAQVTLELALLLQLCLCSLTSTRHSAVAVVGNDTLDFDYYNSVERYDSYVPRRPSCYIDSRNRGADASPSFKCSMVPV